MRWRLGGVHVAQLLTWQVAVVLVLLTAGRGSWVTAAGGTVAAALLALTGVRRHDRWLAQWVGAWIGRRRRGRAPDPPPLPPELVVDAVRGRRGTRIGVIEDGAGWVVALAVEARPGPERPKTDRAGTERPATHRSATHRPATDRPRTDRAGTEQTTTAQPRPDQPRPDQPSTARGTVRSATGPPTVDRPTTVPEIPLRPLAAVLEAADLPLSAAQVVVRLAPGTDPATPAGVAAWVTVRVDAAEVDALVGERGTVGGALGVAVRRCVDRLLGALSAAGLRATPLDVDGLQEAVRLTGGLDAAGRDDPARERAVEGWGSYREAGREHLTSVVTRWPAAGPAALVAVAAEVPHAATVVAVQLRRRRGGGPVTLHGLVRVAAAPGSAGAAEDALGAAAVRHGLRLRPAAGHQLAALRATLPLARPWSAPGGRPLRADRDGFALPLPAVGVPLGVGIGGAPVLLPLLRDRPVRVGVLGTGPAAALLIDALLAADALPQVVGLHPADWAMLRSGRTGGAEVVGSPPDGGRLPALIVAGPGAPGTPGPDTGSWQVTVVVHPLPTPDEVASMRAFDVLVLHRLPPDLAQAVRRFDGIDGRAATRLSQLPPGLVAVVADGRGRFADLSREMA